MKTKYFYSLVLLSILLFQGCSGIKPYPSQEKKNISITTSVDSGSFFSSVKAEVDIFSIDTQCNNIYEGSLSLRNNAIKSGITTAKANKLSFIFSNSSFLGNNSSSINFPVYLKARKGYHYDFIVSYKDDLYNVELFESDTKTNTRRQLDTEDGQKCKNP